MTPATVVAWLQDESATLSDSVQREADSAVSQKRPYYAPASSHSPSCFTASTCYPLSHSDPQQRTRMFAASDTQLRYTGSTWAHADGVHCATTEDRRRQRRTKKRALARLRRRRASFIPVRHARLRLLVIVVVVIRVLADGVGVARRGCGGAAAAAAALDDQALVHLVAGQALNDLQLLVLVVAALLLLGLGRLRLLSRLCLLGRRRLLLLLVLLLVVIAAACASL